MIMNKIFKPFVSLFTAVFKFIDKKIVLPITKFFVKISNLFNKNGRGIDKILSKKSGLIVVSLL